MLDTELANKIHDEILNGRLREARTLIDEELFLRSPCNADELLAIYHTRLPMLPGVRAMTDPRKRAMMARWREHPEAAWWETYFLRVSRSPFLTGKKPGVSWRASFDWLLKPANMIKILEGNYDPPRGQGFISESDDLAAQLSQ